MPSHRYPRLYKSLRHMAAAFGWLLYFYEWVHVSCQTPRHEPIAFVILLISATLLMHAGIAAWISHNKRLAAKGKRGLMTRYTVPVFSQDSLGRQLVVHEQTRQSQEVIVRVDGDTKFYLPALELRQPAKQRKTSRRRKGRLPVPVAELV
ncbi:MAG TPA: hypothetical protein VME68_13190 [Acidobacteriaceae bacterium]|nr:hypothetical protein [Acidobacteriaceae bacterium]